MVNAKRHDHLKWPYISHVNVLDLAILCWFFNHKSTQLHALIGWHSVQAIQNQSAMQKNAKATTKFMLNWFTWCQFYIAEHSLMIIKMAYLACACTHCVWVVLQNSLKPLITTSFHTISKWSVFFFILVMNIHWRCNFFRSHFTFVGIRLNILWNSCQKSSH